MNQTRRSSGRSVHAPADSVAAGCASLRAVPLSVLRSELQARERTVRRLEERRRELEAELESVRQQLLDAVVSRPASKTDPDVRSRETLATVLSRVLTGQVLSVSDAMDAVLRAGYRTSSRHFRTQVNIALIKNPMFTRVSRGQYTASLAKGNGHYAAVEAGSP